MCSRDKTGSYLIGSSRQFGVKGREVDDGMLARMYARATEYLPALPTLSIERTWTGFRSATPDKLPLIGPSADDETVFLATGHEGLGITTSLGNRAASGRFASQEERQPSRSLPTLPPRTLLA